MAKRTAILVALLIAAAGTAWYLNQLTGDEAGPKTPADKDPDFYMRDFTTTTMDVKGRPKNKLHAVYMAHFQDEDTSQLLAPRLEMFRNDKLPLYVEADKAWLTSNNEIVLLAGNVVLWENDASGTRILQANTSKAKVFLKRDYVETDKYAKIVSKRTTITGTGMRAFYNESRLEVLNDVHTTIEQEQAN